MSKKGARALASATVVGLVLSAAISTESVQAARGKVTRLGGANRYETASKVATDNWKDGAKNVILVAGEGYADALSASLLSKELNAPILLTTGSTLSKDAKNALAQLKPTNVYVLGGTGVISENVRNEVKKSYTIAKEFKGASRFDTNKEIADFLVKKNANYAKEVLVVNGSEGLADALSVAPVSAADGKILLIVGKNPDTAKRAEAFIKEHNSKVTVIGTENMVLKSVAEKLNAKRIDGGKNRFETNIRILEQFANSLKGNAVYIANGGNGSYVDSLIASTLAGKAGAPMVLVDGDNSQNTKNALNHIKPDATTDLNVVGGTGVVSKQVENKINGTKITDEGEIESNRANLIDSISIDTKEVNGKPIKTLYSTSKEVSVKLNAVAKNSNKNIIPVTNSKLTWKVASVEETDGSKLLTKDAIKVENGIVTAKAGFKGKAVIKVVTDNMKEATIILKFDNAASVAQRGTVKVVGNEKNQIIDSNKNKEGIQIALDNNKDVKDGEKDGSITFKVIAKDQYGEDFEVKEGVIVSIDGSPAVTKTVKGNTVTLTAKEIGNTGVNINYAGDTIKLEVSVNDKAVEAAGAIDKTEKERQQRLENDKLVQQALGKLSLGDLNNITSDIKLPTKGDNGVNINWTSNNVNVVSNNGKVVRPEAIQGDAIVTLRATLSKGESKEVKDFIITVKAKEITDEEFVDKALSNLNLEENINCIVDDMKLPHSDDKNTVSINWQSSNEKVVSKDGKVTRAYKDEEVVLTATVHKNAISKTKKFNITVKAKEKDVTEELKLISNSLEINNKDNIEDDIKLETSLNDAIISWKSSKPSAISSNGKVVRPNVGQPDDKVVLTATISKGGKTLSKEFNVTVKAEKQLVANTPAELDEIMKKSIIDCKPSVDISLPNFNPSNNEYDFKNFQNLIVEIGAMDFGKPSVSGNYKNDGNGWVMTINFKYRKDVNEVKRQKDETLAQVKKIVKDITNEKMSQFEKELALHDYVVRTADYDTENYKNHSTTLEDHTAYGVLIDHIGVCESYAKAMSLLLEEAGIECKYVTGVSVHNGIEGGGHAWNMVKLDGEWYNLDTTWDDPVSDRNGSVSLTDNANSRATVNHTYFNVSDDILNKDHKRGKFEQNYPACTGTKYSYNNMDVDEYAADGTLIKKVTTKDELDKEILEALKNKKTALSLRIKGFKMTQSELQEELKNVATQNRIWFSSWSTSAPDDYHVNYTIKWNR